VPDEVVETRFGKFLVDPHDCVGTTLKAGTLWDGPGFLQVIAKEFARFSTHGTTIIDVGANIGSFSIYCASQGAWRVIAVEPVPQTMQRLKANLDLNQRTCADVVIPLEVAAYHTTAQLYAPTYDLHNMGATALERPPSGFQPDQPLPGEPLDHYGYLYGDQVSLIKVDAQGCDGAALLGLQNTLRKHQPAIVFEWEADLARHHYPSLDELHQFLKELGYTIWPWPSQPNNYLALPAPTPYVGRR
jgi:FkbM family methyltransferase